jgi:hypothetical protein
MNLSVDFYVTVFWITQTKATEWNQEMIKKIMNGRDRLQLQYRILAWATEEKYWVPHKGIGLIRHVETCPDLFSLQEYTQQNPLSKF